MKLGKLIEVLSKLPQSGIVKNGFGVARCYRGVYSDVSFEPRKDARIADMLDIAKQAIGPVFIGYKGGEYRFDERTQAWIAPLGETVENPISEEDVKQWMLDTVFVDTTKFRNAVDEIISIAGCAHADAPTPTWMVEAAELMLPKKVDALMKMVEDAVKTGGES